MNILSISHYDHAGCGYLLSAAINETTKHYSRAIKVYQGKLQYPFDVLTPTPQQAALLWRWADVIHLHDTLPPGLLPKTVPQKPIVITYHGSQYRKQHELENRKVKALGWIGTVATPDLTQYGLEWMPDCRPDMTDLSGRYRSNKFSVIHCPTKAETKGTKAVTEAMSGLPLTIVKNTPWRECLMAKASAHITIDQFRYGYGCNAIEAWSMQQPVVAGGSIPVLAEIERHVGFIPFYNCSETVADIRTAVMKLKENRDLYAAIAARGRECWYKYHRPEAAARRAVGLYKRALSLPPARIEWERGQSKFIEGGVLIRYVGYATQTQTVIGTKSHRHYTYDGTSTGRVFMVEERDADELVNAKRKGKVQFQLV